MVRTAHAETKHLDYINSLATPQSCRVGLIIGQHFEGDDYILHFAQTPLSSTHNQDKEAITVDDLSEMSIAEHAKHTTRMLSGGMHVLGIFVITDEHISGKLSPKIKVILTHIHKRLEKNQMMYGNTANDKIILYYSQQDESHQAVSYNVYSFEEDNVIFNFSEKEQVWLPIKCRFELNELVSIKSNDVEIPLKKYMKEMMVWVDDSLKSAVYLFNGDLKKGSALVSASSSPKRRKLRVNTNVFVENLEAKVIHVDILLQTNGSAIFDSTNITDSFGCLKVNGIIASNVWLNPNVSYSAVSNAINEDIIRSLSARLGMHFDSLTEGERGFNDSGCIHEIPRRVLLPLPDSPVSFSDYLFPGEGPQEAQNCYQDVMDIKYVDKDAICDLEGQADLTDYYNALLAVTENEEVLPKLPADTHKLMYMVGALVAVLIVIISLLIHYFRV